MYTYTYIYIYTYITYVYIYIYMYVYIYIYIYTYVYTYAVGGDPEGGGFSSRGVLLRRHFSGESEGEASAIAKKTAVESQRTFQRPPFGDPLFISNHVLSLLNLYIHDYVLLFRLLMRRSLTNMMRNQAHPLRNHNK